MEVQTCFQTYFFNNELLTAFQKKYGLEFEQQRQQARGEVFCQKAPVH
jgi:hypothetical protein